MRALLQYLFAGKTEKTKEQLIDKAKAKNKTKPKPEEDSDEKEYSSEPDEEYSPNKE